MTARLPYRPDIDGLRAISVIAVMVFHFFPAIMPGGFIGVDVFFVISGFLVTKTILSDLEKGQFSFTGFYSRRIRRIAPALIGIIIACLLFGTFFSLSEHFQEMGERILYTIGLAQNHYLAGKSDYFNATPQMNPLTHTWSLSIEEQFYLIWAPMIFFGYRSLKNKLWALPVAVFLISMTLNLLMIKSDPKFTFYLLPTRMWELAAGAILCVLDKKLILSHVKQNFISLLALVILVAGFILIKDGHNFPGFLALIPVLSTMMFILTPEAIVNRMLSVKIAVVIGLMSYSLYLWHWPLLSFFNNLFPLQLTTLDLFNLFLASFFISYLSWLKVEAPARRIPERKAARFLIISLVIISAVSGYIASVPWRIYLHTDLEKRAALIEDYDDEDELLPSFCKKEEIYNCRLADPKGPPTVAIMGDSHASHWFPGLREFYNQRNENLLLLVQAKTPPFIGVNADHDDLKDTAKTFKIVLESRSIHTVILSAFWPIYANKYNLKVGREEMKVFIHDPELKTDRQDIVFAVLLGKTLRKLEEAGKKVIFLHDIPSLPFLADKFMPRPFMERNYPVCAFEEHMCTFPYEFVKKSHQAYRNVTTRVLKKFPSVKVLDPLPFFCDEGSGMCLTHPHGKMVYWDEHHIGYEGSKFLIPKLFKSDH